MIEITVPMKIESLNIWKDWHWSKKARNLKEWMNTLAILGKRQVGAQQFKNVEILSRRKKLCDEDNLTGGAKNCLDAIKKLGWIIDDNPKEITLSVKQEKSKIVETIVRLW